ncbi:alpha/beta hydrolase [Parachlamydia sp. AcF125]|uniref:alpha/beta hydrolase n=1 Tax=Parachlamydia sp. AcF125 TaxID=2795736 RepID=UPI001BCA0CBA|nr:alpha/beta hydrolase [Parachlamydia sp. AcF125]MBS4169074.1 hypothetical protein [Parachlamydia sp. AcF125]
MECSSSFSYSSSYSDTGNPLFHKNEVEVTNPMFSAVPFCPSDPDTGNALFHKNEIMCTDFWRLHNQLGMGFAQPSLLDTPDSEVPPSDTDSSSDTDTDPERELSSASAEESLSDTDTDPERELSSTSAEEPPSDTDTDPEQELSSTSQKEFRYPLDYTLEDDSNFAPQLWMLNDRRESTSPTHFSAGTQIARVSFSFSVGFKQGCFAFSRKAKPIMKKYKEFSNFKIEKLSDRRVLILIHGFTVQHTGALKMLCKVADKVKHSYDVVIGYSYPAYAKFYEYLPAERNALQAAKERLPAILGSIQKVAREVHIIAHSMGTIAAMHALNQESSPKINKLFLLGGAVEEASIFDCEGQGCTTMKRALENVENIYALYSCHDKVLPWRSLFNPSRTLGLPDQAIQQRPIAERVRLIDTTPSVKGHSDYFASPAIFKFFRLANDEEVSIQGRYFSLTSTHLSTTVKPFACSKGKEKESEKDIKPKSLKKRAIFKFS